MKTIWIIVVIGLFSNFTLANSTSDTLKLCEDDKVIIFELEEGNPKVTFKDGFKTSDTTSSIQIRRFYDRPILLGSENKSLVAAIGIGNAVKKYLPKAIEHQNKHFFNDLGVNESQIKIIYKTSGSSVKFYYLKAYNVKSYEKGSFDNFWCDEKYRKFSFVEVNRNGKEIYFKKVKSQK